MSRFNTKTAAASRTTNLAGGPAFKESPKLELASILLTSFVQDQFYRDANATLARVDELVDADPLFAAKASIYARSKFGMRSITHATAARIAKTVHGAQWTRRYFDRVISRPDDMLEIIALAGVHPLPNALKKGFAQAFGRFDGYQLAKYRGEGKAVSLVDLVNLVRPKPNEKNAQALAALVKGELKSTETWEAKLSGAGQKAETQEDAAELKNAAWGELIRSRKLGYFALLRNLRNIAEQAPDALAHALDMLKDPDLIKRSKVLPFRFQTAAEEITKWGGPSARAILTALSMATDSSVSNVPRLSGRTLVALDGSGSMDGKPLEIGSLFAAVLYKSQDADVVIFSHDARRVTPNPTDSTLTIAKDLRGACPMGGTDLNAVFVHCDQQYDRVVILSDMQNWMDGSVAQRAFNAYAQRTRNRPLVYSWDLRGYGTLQFPEPNVYALAGFSEKVFDVMGLLEQDRQALVHEIEAIEL